MMNLNEKFTKVYKEYVNLVFQYALSKVKNEDLAMEFTQQVFTRYFEKIREVPEDIIKPWLLLCCKNEIIDHFRKMEVKQRYCSMKMSSDVSIVAEDNTERLVEQMVQEEFTFKILETLKKKNESWFQIIEDVVILGKSQEEAAEYLGISVEVLRAKLYRARKFLRKQYGDQYKNIKR